VSLPGAPRGAGAAGRRLWRAIVTEFELAEHEMTLLRQAVRVADICEDLQKRVDDDGLLVDGRAHPGLVELRQQRILLGRLIVALRVPLGEDEAGAPAAGLGQRTQRRPIRGMYALRGGAS
jgi:hypothetical protein